MKLIAELMGADLGTITQALEDICLAEREIKRMQLQYPNAAERLDKAFLLLRRPSVIKSDELYLRFVRELLQRVAEGGDTRQATKAEVLANLSEFTLQAKPNKLGSLVMARLMELVMGDMREVLEMVSGLRLAVGQEDYAGQVDEEIARLQRVTVSEERVITG